MLGWPMRRSCFCLCITCVGIGSARPCASFANGTIMQSCGRVYESQIHGKDPLRELRSSCSSLTGGNTVDNRVRRSTLAPLTRHLSGPPRCLRHKWHAPACGVQIELWLFKSQPSGFLHRFPRDVNRRIWVAPPQDRNVSCGGVALQSPGKCSVPSSSR